MCLLVPGMTQALYGTARIAEGPPPPPKKNRSTSRRLQRLKDERENLGPSNPEGLIFLFFRVEVPFCGPLKLRRSPFSFLE